MCGKAILKTAIMAMALLPAWLTAGDSAAQETGQARLLQPALDEPLRDPSICRGPDGVYYLTGTSASTRPDGALDFDNNAGIRLWKSADLQKWDDLGFVFAITKEGGLGYNLFGFLRNHHARPDVPDAPRDLRGMTSPEIHYLKDTFWITFSQNGYGTGLLKSKTGKAEGPYDFHAVITSQGDDPSLFQDKDGKVYWLWSPAWIAEMKEDLSGLAGAPRLLTCVPNSKMGDDVLLGDRGPFLFFADGAYYLTMADARERLGINTNDTMVGRSATLFGPYSKREIMVPHGGQTTVFQAPDGSWLATFSGQDRYAAFRDRAGFVPLDWVGNHNLKGHNEHISASNDDLPRWRKSVWTTRGPWHRMRPLLDKPDMRIRDMNMIQAPDGFFYFTGSVHGEPYKARLVIYRSRDLKNWEEIEVYHFDKVAQVSPERRAYRSDKRGDWGNHFMDCEIHYIKGHKTFFIYAGMYNVNSLPGDKGNGHAMLLRSTTGKAEGPYEYWAPGPSQCSFFEDDDGTDYASMGGSALYKMNPDLKGWTTINRFTTPPGGGGLCEDAGGDVIRIHGLWVYFTTGISSGHWCNNPSGSTSLLSYDFHYYTAEKPEGPWTLGATPGIPFGGHGGVFQGLDGHYYGVFWGDDCFAPWRCKPGLVRLTTEMKNGQLHIDVDENWTPDDFKPGKGEQLRH